MQSIDGEVRMIQLDERLLAAEALAGRCDRVVDVGTNHGFLPVHMLQSGLCGRAVLCDVSADALERARRTVAAEGLEGKTELIVTDGLQGIEIKQGDVVTVCGMGARTIAHILDENPGCPVVMQPNVEVRLLRRHLEKIGMHIARERIAFAAGRYYVLLRAEPGREAGMSDYEAHIGPALLRDRPPLFREYLQWRLGVTQRALDGMKIGRDAEKLRQAQSDVDDVKRALREVESR